MCKLKTNILVFLCILCAFYGNMYGVSSIVIRPSAEALCTANPFITFFHDFTDDGYFGDSHRFMLEYSTDRTSWTRFPSTTRSLTWGYTQRTTNLKEGWYRVAVAREDEMEMPDKWVVSEPIYMEKIEGGCTPFTFMWPDEVSDDVCPRGTILFREDFGGNNPSDPVTSQTPLTTMSSRYRQVFNVLSTVSSGLFVVAKHGWRNNWDNYLTEDLYSQWFVQDDHTYPNDYTRGYLLEVDGIGGNDAFYTTTFPVCSNLDLSFSAYVANVLEPAKKFEKPQVRFLIQDEATGDTILEQSSGQIEPAPADYLQYGVPPTMSAPWHLVGASFHVPEGVELIRLSIFNDVDVAMGNDFAMDDIEIRLCKPEVTIESEQEICMDSAYTFQASVTTDGGFIQPYNYLWQYAPDSLPFNSDGWVNVQHGLHLSFDSVALSDDGWYRLCVTSHGVDVETERYCRAMSEPFHLVVNDCTPPCPELQYMHHDTTVCDTEMPFTWYGMVFEEPSVQATMEHSPRGCDSIWHTCALDTVHCEILWPIIVNKYNWQLLCDNVALRELFPDKQVRGFQWYKNEEPIPGATEDDYSEQNELHGIFQLCVTMDDEQVIWSNIIELAETSEASQPAEIRIYDSRGSMVREDQMRHGIYLYRYEQGGHTWTEKRMIP